MRNHLYYLLTGLFIIAGLPAFSQTSLPLNTFVTQNFNAIGNSGMASLPPGWKFSAPGNGNTAGYVTSGNATAVTQAASSGSPATGGSYNWATTAGTDRSIGFKTSGTYTSPNSIMAFYRNNTGAGVSSFTVAFALERYVVNTSTVSIAFFSSTDGSIWTAQPAGDISTADFPAGANVGTFANPKTLTKIVTVNAAVPDNGDIYFRWVFTNTGSANAQGLGLDDVSVFAGTATPVVIATLKDILQVDNGTVNQFNEGDVIRYKAVIKNTGTGDANNVQITLPTPPVNTTMVGGSVKTSAVAVDDNYTVSFNTTLNGSSVLTNDVGIPLPTAVISFGPTASPAATLAGSVGTTNAGGILTVNADGTFSYTPPAGFSGTDQFKYITGNGNLPNNDALVSIVVGADITFSTTNIDPLCNSGSNGSITFNASGGNGALMYSITGAAGTYQPSPVFNGLAAGSYNLAVKDAGGYIKTGSASLNNPAVIVVSGAIPNLVYTTAMTIASFTKTGGTGSAVWSVTGLPAGTSINSSAGDVTGSPTQTGSFTAMITATDANGCTGTKGVSFTVAPKLGNDSYAVVGNTQVVANGHSAPATPFTADATNIVSNDASNAAITITSGTFATVGGGSITIDATGKFTFTPLNGSTAADSYVYTATSNGVSATATINFIITNMVWYVNNTYGGAGGISNGTSHRPYVDVATAEGASAVNQIIYVHTGSGNTNGNALLKSGQTLRGAGSALSVGALSIAAGTKPMLSGTITLANNVTADGFDMNTATIPAFTNAGTTVTGVTINAGAVTTTTGSGITLSGTGNNVSITFASLTTNGAINAVSLTNTAGTVTINGGTLTGGGGTVFNISGGSATISCAAVIVQSTTAQRAINISGATGGIITFSGPVNSSGSSAGINLTGNTGTTINFTGQLNLNTSTNSAFTATGGGTISASNANNTISTTTATALNVANTTIGVSGLNFRSISSNGASSGVVLNNTGASGGLSITGNASANTGGTIQNCTSHGILLTNTTNPSFNYLNIQNTSGSGIKGTQVNGFTCTNTIIGNTGTGGGTDESNIAFNSAASGTETNILGTVTITNNTLTNSQWHGIDIQNFNGTIDLATISSNTITSTTSTATSKGTGIRFQALGSPTTVANVTKAAISFNNISNFPSGAGIFAQGGNPNASGAPGIFGVPGNVTNVINISGNFIKGFSTVIPMGTNSIAAMVSGKGQGNFNISGNGSIANPLTNMVTTAIQCGTSGNTIAAFTVDNNVIVANNTLATNGIGGGTAASFGSSDTPMMTWNITNNNISNTDGNGILAWVRGASGFLTVKIQNNTVAAPLTGVRPGIRVDAGNSSSINDGVCLNISGNTSAGSGGTQGIGLRKQGTVSNVNTFSVHGMAATASPGVESFINGLNPLGNGTLLISATAGFTSCNNP
jgi:hypothetical protein